MIRMRPSRTAASRRWPAGNLDEPLLRDHRLDNFAAALRTRHVERIGFFFDNQAGSPHIGPQFFCGTPTGPDPSMARRWRLLSPPGPHRKDRQPVPLADLVVVGVMAGGDLERSGAEVARHVNRPQ